ncbi:MAG: HD domain-containing protein, partial [Spirochaetales bacterium]|nr:HD domain-containing protein [Spirochaetales bacterium]
MKYNAIDKMIIYYQDDVIRINHALKVYGFAESIALSENLSGEKLEILLLAAILHDIGIKEAEKKYNSSAGNFQEIEGPPIARNIMEELVVPQNIIERVCFLVGNHHSYKKIDDIDFQILIEADFFVNAYENKMERKTIESFCQKYF